MAVIVITYLIITAVAGGYVRYWYREYKRICDLAENPETEFIGKEWDTSMAIHNEYHYLSTMKERALMNSDGASFAASFLCLMAKKNMLRFSKYDDDIKVVKTGFAEYYNKCELAFFNDVFDTADKQMLDENATVGYEYVSLSQMAGRYKEWINTFFVNRHVKPGKKYAVVRDKFSSWALLAITGVMAFAMSIYEKRYIIITNGDGSFLEMLLIASIGYGFFWWIYLKLIPDIKAIKAKDVWNRMEKAGGRVAVAIVVLFGVFMLACVACTLPFNILKVYSFLLMGGIIFLKNRKFVTNRRKKKIPRLEMQDEYMLEDRQKSDSVEKITWQNLKQVLEHSFEEK